MTKKVGIFAGTFDPVHEGHMAFAKEALSYGLDKVFFLVEPRPRRKQGVRALDHRYKMVKIVTDKNPKLGVIKLEQARFTPRTTLPLLEARFKGSRLHFLFGDDVLNHMIDHLADWPHVDELLEASKILIGSRRHDEAKLADRINDLERYGLKIDYDFLYIDWPLASSSGIRQELRKGRSVSGLNPFVATYIHKNGLYSSPVPSSGE